MLRIAICDDMPEQISLIQDMLESYFRQKNMADFTCQTFDNPFLFSQKLESENTFDLLLLDICMPGLLGTDIAKGLRCRGDKSEIIFLTSSEDFALEAFSLRVANYLVKPFTEEQFREAMEHVVDNLVVKSKKKLLIKQKKCIYAVNIDDIVFIESAGHLLVLHLYDGSTLETRQTMAQMKEELARLAGIQFIYPYKGFIVNQEFIECFGQDVIRVVGGYAVPFSKPKRTELKKEYMQYMFQK
jgi:DNA-binding LytR/AlgR family response regulator